VPLPYYPQPVATPTMTYQSGPSSSTTTASVSIDPSYERQMHAAGFTAHDCFAAGTMVHVPEGRRPIESIVAGDRVLSQDTRTGALSFQPVVAVDHSRPSPVHRIVLGEEAIVATGIHRFWKPGEGWSMARDLKAGDRLRVLGGVAEVRSVEAGPVQPVFNLRVAGGDSFFVGDRGVLAHDQGMVKPSERPFDRFPSQAGPDGPPQR
jgi:Pretoxin HINT domain